jgi:hypothetical protein
VYYITMESHTGRWSHHDFAAPFCSFFHRTSGHALITVVRYRTRSGSAGNNTEWQNTRKRQQGQGQGRGESPLSAARRTDGPSRGDANH